MPADCPQVLINNTRDGVDQGDTFTDDGELGRLFLGGTCDEIVKRLVIDLDWQEDFKEILPE